MVRPSTTQRPRPPALALNTHFGNILSAPERPGEPAEAVAPFVPRLPELPTEYLESLIDMADSNADAIAGHERPAILTVSEKRVDKLVPGERSTREHDGKENRRTSWRDRDLQASVNQEPATMARATTQRSTALAVDKARGIHQTETPRRPVLITQECPLGSVTNSVQVPVSSESRI